MKYIQCYYQVQIYAKILNKTKRSMKKFLIEQKEHFLLSMDNNDMRKKA